MTLQLLRHDNRIVAFANFWNNGPASTCTLDLMRHVPNAPEGSDGISGPTDSWSRRKPTDTNGSISGWRRCPAFPIIGSHRVGRDLAGLFFRYGERLYHFEGVRIFKSKFKPEWRTKYLAYEHGLRLPQTLFDIASLISASARRSNSMVKENGPGIALFQHRSLAGGGLRHFLRCCRASQRRRAPISKTIAQSRFGNIPVFWSGNAPSAFVVLMADPGCASPLRTNLSPTSWWARARRSRSSILRSCAAFSRHLFLQANAINCSATSKTSCAYPSARSI